MKQNYIKPTIETLRLTAMNMLGTSTDFKQDNNDTKKGDGETIWFDSKGNNGDVWGK